MFNCGECGCVITAETQKGHNYLRCTKRRVPCHQRYVREESVDGQIAAAIGNVSIRTDWADRMLAELAGEQGAQQAKVKKAEESLTAEFADCEARLDELLDMALAKSISQEEYKSKKAVLLKRKVEIREELTNLTDKSRERFEPLTEFVKEAKQAVFLARERNPDACRDFLKKHGSNCLLADGQLRIEFQNPWKSVAEFTSALVTASEINPRISDSSNWRCLLDKVRTFF
jgi:hypothetical protein